MATLYPSTPNGNNNLYTIGDWVVIDEIQDSSKKLISLELGKPIEFIKNLEGRHGRIVRVGTVSSMIEVEYVGKFTVPNMSLEKLF